MAISDTIQSMYENVGEVYDTITNVTLPEHKNIENIPRTIRDSYLEIINNGINVIYDNWEKVTGEGTSLTLTPTEEAPMKIVYKGNTYQNGEPTPDTPIPIQVVSGDNSIEVCGKNLLDNTKSVGGGLNSRGGYISTGVSSFSISGNSVSITTTNTYRGLVTDYIEVNPSTTYSISFTHSQDSYTYNTIIKWYDEEKNYINSSSYTSPSNAKYLRVNLNISETGTFTLSNIQIEKNNQATTYQPYTSQSYPINLPVENLFTFGNLTEETRNGVTKTITGSKINLNGTTTSAIDIVQRTNTGVHLKAGTYAYTLFVDGTITVPSGSGSNTALLFTNSSNTSVFNGTMVSLKENGKLTGTFTLNADTDLYLQIYSNSSGQAFNCNLYCQIEKGIKANHYTPYGTTPIWLGWIPNTTYQDKIDKSSGKNLTNIDDYLGGSVGSNGTISANDHITSFTNTNGVITFTTSTTYRGTYSDYIEVEPSTSYVISFDKPTTGVTYFGFFNWYDTNKTFIGRDSISTPNRTSPSNAKYCVMFLGINEVGTAKITNIMLNKGTTALPYEPYGTSWYLKKEIGKELIRPDSATIENNGVRTNAFVPKPIEAYPLLFCNYFGRAASYNGATNYNSTTPNKLGFNSGGQTLCNILGYTTTTEYINFFANNNVYVYYPLETPTYTLIEGELLNQLEAIKMSYEGQTNISQESNDLASVLNASALTQM